MSYEKNSIIILPYNYIITIINNVDNIIDFAISNGNPPYEINKFHGVSEEKLQKITGAIYFSPDGIIPTINSILNENENYNSNTIIVHMDKFYRFDYVDENNYVRLKQVDGDDSIMLTRDEFQKSIDNEKNIPSYIKLRIEDDNTKQLEKVEENQSKTKSKEELFSEIIENIITNEKNDYSEEDYIKDLMTSPKSQFAKDVEFMKNLVKQYDKAMEIVESNDGEKLINDVCEFFKNLTKNDKEQWSRNLRMRLDYIMDNENGEDDIEEVEQEIDNLIETAMNNFKEDVKSFYKKQYKGSYKNVN